MKTKTFKNITRVTENYDGTFIGCGWYAYTYAITTTPRDEFGGTGYAEHTGIEFISDDDDMSEGVEYIDFIGDYGFAVAEVESNSDYVLSIYFSNDYDAIEDALTTEYLEGLRDSDPDATEDEARELASIGMFEIDSNGCVHRRQLACERYDANIIK